jgi:hypothetical protein
LLIFSDVLKKIKSFLNLFLFFDNSFAFEIVPGLLRAIKITKSLKLVGLIFFTRIFAD